jgi:phosphoglycerol transferase MdoB-like AlkP superfamily enzyme
MTTSMMRKRPQLKLNCLPKILAQQNPKTFTYWLHGGEGEFDGQKAFWDSQNTELTMARRDFPADLPANDWGMGDISFFHAAWERLLQSFAQNAPTRSFGMWLSVSNHPPWKLPPDAPELLRKEASTLSQPSYQTTLYADFALGQWLKTVSESILWPDTILIILGDHGQQESPVFGAVTFQPQRQAVLAHIPLILTGGLMAELKNDVPGFAENRVSDAWVSQADLAATLALWLGAAPISFFGEPFFSTRHAPVISMSGDKIWLAEQADARPPRDFLHAAAETDPHRFEVTYTRAFLRLISL